MERACVAVVQCRVVEKACLRLERVLDVLLAAGRSRKTNVGGAKTARSDRSSAASIELAVCETCATAGVTVAKK